MIKENQKLFNRLNVLSDAFLFFLSLPLAFWVRFYLLPGGVATVPLSHYLILGLPLTAVHLFACAALGLYRSFRNNRLRDELSLLFRSILIDGAVMLSALFLNHQLHFSRWTLAIALFLSFFALGTKRVILRKILRHFRQQGYNQKHVLILGCGPLARSYLEAIRTERELGYAPMGYVSNGGEALPDLPCLGGFDQLEELLLRRRPDEVISAIEAADHLLLPTIIDVCEKTGTKLAVIPFYAAYMPSRPQFDYLGKVPLMNIRRIPLDNWGNAFCKRAMDIVGSLLLILLSSPVMLFCAIGVKLSSPGPIIFRQERIGLNKKRFYMYKFRSMRVNQEESTGWSRDRDDRKTRFGAFLRKCSLDEFPQFFNVLKGDMSLVGPRPEVPFYVDQFREEIPLYMVKHQVRPGITGWAQVNDLRGDTSIKARIEHDIYYIEHWSLLFDVKILLMTLFKGKFMNQEKLK